MCAALHMVPTTLRIYVCVYARFSMAHRLCDRFSHSRIANTKSIRLDAVLAALCLTINNVSSDAELFESAQTFTMSYYIYRYAHSDESINGL